MEGESCAADSSSKAPAMRRKRSKDKREAAEVREEQKLASTAPRGPPAPYEVSLGEAPYEPHQQQQAPPQLQHPLPSPPRYRGIRMRKWGKWVAEIREPNKRSRIWLGSYSTAVAAARAYDTAVYYLRGRSARVNFPEELARELEGASSAAAGLSAAAIRKKAIEVGTRVDAAESGLQAPLAQQQQHEEEENMEEMEDSSSPRYQLPSPVTPTALGQTSGTRKQGKGKGPAGAAPHKAAKKPDLNQQPSDDDDEDGDDGNYD